MPHSRKRRDQGKHSRIRSDHATEIAEDYVEAIAEVIEASGTCRAVDLASRFEVSHVTVNRTIGRLARDGWVETEPYGPVVLTAKGKQLARKAAERHAVVLKFLMAIGVRESVAKIDSEGIEHHVSPETLDAMRAFLSEHAD
ncbi:MAG: manganese-binding transcriptional regulator MntR [Planctomycetes bacterium]|nr:manganese-binding transcriptional regulator MntR [Planctomycetota bacterium]